MPPWLRALGTSLGRRPTILLVGVGLLLFVSKGSSLFSKSPPPPEQRLDQHTYGGRTVPGHGSAVLGGLSDLQNQLEAMKQQLKKAEEQATTFKRELAERTRAASPPPGMSDAQITTQIRQEVNEFMARMPNEPPPAPHAQAPVVQQGPKSQRMQWSFTTRERAAAAPVAAPPDPPASPQVILPAGSVANGRLINGLATLANEEGLPVTIALDSDFHAPNDAVVPLGTCHVTAIGVPEDVTARVAFALETLSCVLPNGETLNYAVKGWVTADDNVNGAHATVFYNDGQILKYFGQATIPAALSALLNQFQDTVRTASAFGIFQQEGSATADELLGRMGDMFIDRARPFLIPVIWVDPNQSINVYIRDMVAFEGVSPTAWEAPARPQKLAYD